MNPMDKQMFVFPLAPSEAENGAGAGAPAGGTSNGETAATQDAPAGTDGAPSPATEGDGPDEDNPFRLEDVPEEAREHVERLQRQMQSTLSRARARDKEKVQAAEDALALVDALNDDETAADTLRDLASRLNMTVAEAREMVEGEQHDDGLKKDVEELKSREDKRLQDERVRVVKQHVEEGIERYGDDISDDTRELLTFTALSNRGEGGLPDIERAVELVQAHDAAVIDRFIKSKQGEDAPDLSGGTGIAAEDTSTEAGRLRAAEAIAARHLGAGAAS